ncbi:MAG: response regulator [Planctomycetota bacterium]|nr:response regulator [Planctomycetota bacterium]
MPTVMVVDDTAVIREAVAKLLRREGFQTICAANGKEALHALTRSEPDLVLLDIMMPEMDGMECLEQLRSDPKWKSTPVIMMTALSDDENQRRATQLGASDYMVKAKFTVEQMLDRIRRLIGDKQLPN